MQSNLTIKFKHSSVTPSLVILPCIIDHFTVVHLVAQPLNDCEAGIDFVWIETSLLL